MAAIMRIYAPKQPNFDYRNVVATNAVRRKSIRHGDFVLSLALLTYFMFFGFFRHTPGLALGVAVLVSMATIYRGRYIHDLYSIPILMVSTVYLALSYEHLLPTAWTRYWDSSFIFRQWMWAPLLTIFSSALATIFAKNRDKLISQSWFILMISFIFGRVSLYLSPLEFSDKLIFTVYTLVPENAIFMFMLSICIFYRLTATLSSFIVLLVFIPLFTSAQSLLLYLCIIFIKFFNARRAILWAVPTVIVCAMLIAPSYTQVLYRMDTSSGFRATLWRDAGQAFVQSSFVGVGFGTEYIRNKFESPERISSWKVTSERSDERLLIGTHNTGYDIGMRMGIAGLIAMLSWIYSVLRMTASSKNPDYKMNLAAFTMFMLNNGLNMGVTSINFLLCTTLCAGWIIGSAWRFRNDRLRENGRHVAAQ